MLWRKEQSWFSGEFWCSELLWGQGEKMGDGRGPKSAVFCVWSHRDKWGTSERLLVLQTCSIFQPVMPGFWGRKEVTILLWRFLVVKGWEKSERRLNKDFFTKSEMMLSQLELVGFGCTQCFSSFSLLGFGPNTYTFTFKKKSWSKKMKYFTMHFVGG